MLIFRECYLKIHTGFYYNHRSPSGDLDFNEVMTATVANVTVFVWPQLLVDVLMIAQVSDVESWKLYFKTACMSVS